ncbi:xylosyltransferase 1-like [Ptychodera flava]|uniref:xylosyltransferase 1-like n=1 Tax=Ptychodera flava TaxID=63121 RepID=UPI00396AAAFA
MAAPRLRNRTGISCGRYRFILYLATVVMLMQLLVAWSFFSVDTSDGKDVTKRRSSGSSVDDEVLKGERTPLDKEGHLATSVRKHQLKANENSLDSNKLIDNFQISRGNSQFLNQKGRTNQENRLFVDFNKQQQHSNGDNLQQNQHQLSNDGDTADRNNNFQKTRSNSRNVEMHRGNNVGGEIQQDFLARCTISGKDALSALMRAESIQCKQEIADTYCIIEEGIIYPQILPRLCPVPGKPLMQVEFRAERFNPATDKPVRIVFILIVHGRAFRQVRRLFKVLYHVDHYFYIHVDARSDYLYRELNKMSQWYPNVRVAPWRMSTIWGGASLLQMLLKCMSDLLEMKDWHWDFFINLSESDFPIKTNSQLVAFLSLNKNANFLKSHGRDDAKFIRKQGLDRTFLECDNHMWRLGDRRLPKGIAIDGGSDWIALNRHYCEYLTTSDDALISGVKKFYKYTLLPAESFFHTVLENSELCETMVDNNLRVTNWKRKLGCQCQYKHIVDWCGCSPNDFKPEDLQKVKTSRPAFFARKFEPVINQESINQLDSWLYGDYPIGTAGLESYWQNTYHMEDSRSKSDDVSWTYYQAFIRLASESFRASIQSVEYQEGCMFAFNMDPVEVNFFFQSDEFQGMLVMYEGMSRTGQKDWLETWLVPHRQLKIIDPVGPASRLLSMQVSTDYDLKERVFRNFGGLIGPYDDPRVLLRISQGEHQTVTLMWLDPIEQVAEVHDIKLEADAEIAYHKTEFYKPLRPGKWTLKMIYNQRAIAETSFLVLPLAVQNMKTVNEANTWNMHNGPPGGVYTPNEKTYYGFDILSKEAKSAALNLVQENSRKTGFELTEWIDRLVGNSWKVLDTCVTKPMKSIDRTTSCSVVKSCENTHWSSMAPDPKSELGPIKSDGRIR